MTKQSQVKNNNSTINAKYFFCVGNINTRTDKSPKLTQNRRRAVGLPRPTHQIPFESLINCVLITSREQIPPIPEMWTREAGSQWGSVVAVNCIVFHYQSLASSFISQGSGRGELMSKHSWGRPGNTHTHTHRETPL